MWLFVICRGIWNVLRNVFLKKENLDDEESAEYTIAEEYSDMTSVSYICVWK